MRGKERVKRSEVVEKKNLANFAFVTMHKERRWEPSCQVTVPMKKVQIKVKQKGRHGV